MRSFAWLVGCITISTEMASFASGQPPQVQLGKPLWSRATIHFKWECQGLCNETKVVLLQSPWQEEKEKSVKALIDKAITEQGEQPLLPGVFPLVRNGLVMYRDYAGIVAVHVRDLVQQGKRIARAGETEWRTVEFGRSLIAYSDPRLGMKRVLEVYQAGRQGQVLFENSSIGSSSSDESMVYAIDEAALAVPDSFKRDKASFSDLSDQNALWAVERHNGRVLWFLGAFDENAKSAFANTHFLGPPLASATKLWILNESEKGQIRLVELDPRKIGKDHQVKVLGPPLELAKAPAEEPYRNSLRRRFSPVLLTLVDDILVCPTHAGTIHGVNPENKKIAWTFRYREPVKVPPEKKKGRWLDPDPRNELDMHWRYPGTHFTGGKLLFTAPDHPDIHCLQARDGKPLWTAKKHDDLYLAGIVGDRVLLVGGKECRALDLADGKEVWKIKTGVPSGKGAVDAGKFYLPLRKGADTGKAELCVIDPAAGKIVEHLLSPDDEPLGNLVFHEDLLVSQSATKIMAFSKKR